MKAVKPRYTHDSTCCTFVGTFEGRAYRDSEGEFDLDLYYCHRADRPASLASLIGRYGDAGPAYMSSHPPEAFAQPYKPQPWERACLDAAKEAGLL